MSSKIEKDIKKAWTPCRKIISIRKGHEVITCHVKYLIDPYQISAFEAYSKLWIKIVKRMGGIHHGYFLPAEGANNVAYCLFSFPGLAEYEQYRKNIVKDEESVKAAALAEQHKFIVSYERTFLRPLLE